MVYVLNKDGAPLMPTERHGKVHRMLKEGKPTTEVRAGAVKLPRFGWLRYTSRMPEGRIPSATVSRDAARRTLTKVHCRVGLAPYHV